MLKLSRRLHDAISENENIILGSMLLLLHLAMWWGFGSGISASLMLAHFGLFLLWQPIWQRDQRFDAGGIVIFAAMIGAFLLWLNWWLLFGWLVLLTGLVAGRTFSSRSARVAYLLTLVFLVSELLILCVSSAFQIASTEPAVQGLFRFGLMTIPVLVLFIPLKTEQPGVDIFRATAASLMVALLALGAMLLMYHRGLDYPVALLVSLFALASFLLIISFLLTPTGGMSGFAQFWERALLNIGTPFEDWLTALATLAEEQQTPEEFIAAASEELLRLPWVKGVQWRTGAGEHQLGEQTRHVIDSDGEDLHIRTFTERPVGPMLLLHCKLLMQVLVQFHISKLRERELAQQAHLQAIYETGARVTHDIKNLLQGLQSITAAIEATEGKGEDARERARALFAQQMPHVTARLQGALAKLQAPGSADHNERPASAWWQHVCRAEAAPDVAFSADISTDATIPVELFDSVLENLVENARVKRVEDKTIHIQVRLTVTPEEIALTVTDDGAPVPEEKSPRIGQQAMQSDYGLGIGLYQASRQAELHGYTLALVDNRAGRVSFCLARDRSGDPDQFGLFRHSA